MYKQAEYWNTRSTTSMHKLRFIKTSVMHMHNDLECQAGRHYDTMILENIVYRHHVITTNGDSNVHTVSEGYRSKATKQFSCL